MLSGANTDNFMLFQKKQHDQHVRSRELKMDQLAMVRNIHATPRWIPATVMGKLGPVSYEVKLQDVRRWR